MDAKEERGRRPCVEGVCMLCMSKYRSIDMPHPGTVSPGEGESSTVSPVLPSRSAVTHAKSELGGLKLLEWQKRAQDGQDAGVEVDLQVEQMKGKQRGQQSRTALTPPKGWTHFVAGGVGGMCGAIVTSPLDVVKTRLQSDLFKSKVTIATSTQTGMLAQSKRLAYHFVETGHILRNIAVKESPRALFKGLGPTLAGVIPARSINFYTYGNGKLFIADHLNGGRESPAVHLLAAACAGVVTATATNPIWVVKTRLQLESHAMERAVEANRQAAVHRSDRQGSHARFSTWSKQAMASNASSLSVKPKTASQGFSKYFKPSPSPPRPSTNSLQMTIRIIQSEGVAGLYKGMSASYLGVAEGTIQWTLYEKLKKTAISSAGSDPDKPPSRVRQWAGTVGAAGAAKLTASLITYPHEVVRTRLRQEPPPGKPQKYHGLLQTIRLVLKEEGAAALYGGLSAHLLRVVPNAAIMFVVYESVLSFSHKK